MAIVAYRLVAPGITASLHRFVPTPVVKVQIMTGLWIVWARVVLISSDGDNQDAFAELDDVTNGSPGESFDRADIRISPGLPQAVFLQGTVRNPKKSGLTLALNCATFNGTALQVSLIASEIDLLNDFVIA